MRFAAAACALAIVVCVAVFGAVLAQRATAPVVASAPASAPAAKAAPAAGMAAATKPSPAQTVVATAAPTPAVAAPAAPAVAPSGASAMAQAAAPAPAQSPPWRRPHHRPPRRPRRPRRSIVRAIRTRSASPGSWRSTPPAGRASASSTSSNTTSCSPARWCSPSMTAPGRTTPRKSWRRSPPIAPRRSSSRSASTSMWAPEILRQVAAAGHTIGSHTWSHKDLAKLTVQDGKDEIEKGISAVRCGAGRSGRAVLPLPGAAPSARDGHLSGRAQHRHFLDRHGFASTSRSASPSRSSPRC